MTSTNNAKTVAEFTAVPFTSAEGQTVFDKSASTLMSQLTEAETMLSLMDILLYAPEDQERLEKIHEVHTASTRSINVLLSMAQRGLDAVKLDEQIEQ